MFLVLLTACDALQPYLEEVREETTEVVYGGTVLEGPPSSDNVNFTEGVLAFYLDGQADPVLATQPFVESPGYWRVTLPPGESFTLRVEGSEEDSYPAVWRGSSPDETGIWYTGALFSWPHSQVDPFFETLAESLSLDIGDLKKDPVVHLWGQVSNPEDASAADWPVRDGDGKRAEVFCFEQLEDGSLVRNDDGPVHYVFAFDLAPGDIEVAGVVYRAEAGDLLAPWWFEVMQ